MIRVVGCFMLIVSGAVTGKILADKTEERYRTVQMLYEMSCELIPMLKALMTTEEIFSSLLASGKYQKLGFLSCDVLTPSGRFQLESSVNGLCIDHDLKSRLCRFFEELGSADIERESAKAELMKNILENELLELRSSYKSDKKLRMILGLLAGAFAAVVMI